MKKIIAVLIGVVWLQTTYAQVEKSIDWSADLDFLAKELSEKHYNFFTIRSKDDLLAGIEAIKSASENLNDFQIALKTQQLLAKFGDSHTMLNFSQLLDRDKLLPIQLLWTADGLHVWRTRSENKELLGHRIVAINRIPVKTIADNLSTLFTIDNGAIVKMLIPELISSWEILAYFGFSNSPQTELTLANDKTYVIKPVRMNKADWVTFKPDSIAFVVKNSNVLFTARYFPAEKIYYMLYNSCWSKELELEYRGPEKAEKMPSFKEFEQQAFAALERKKVDKIIFDVRYNGGGSSSQGTEFIEKLAVFLAKNPHISPYVVIGRKTFSSAILNAMDFKRLTNAVFVGEETSGKPNHFGEIRDLELPSSKLHVNYSTKYFKKTDKEVNTITPDVTIEATFDDFTQGIDPIYEWIKRQ